MFKSYCKIINKAAGRAEGLAVPHIPKPAICGGQIRQGKLNARRYVRCPVNDEAPAEATFALIPSEGTGEVHNCRTGSGPGGSSPKAGKGRSAVNASDSKRRDVPARIQVNLLAAAEL